MTAGRALITGGGGFVGSHLAEGFGRLGYMVTALDRGFDDKTSERLRDCKCVEGLVSRTALDALATRFDLVVHAAALTSSPHVAGVTEAAHVRANLDPLLDALDFVQRTAVPTFVFVSSSGVFSVGDADEMLLETTPPTGRSAYAVAKRTGEEIVAAAETPELRAVAVRLGYVYGPHERSRPSRVEVSLVRQWADSIARSEPILVRTPGVRRDWTFAGDLAAAIDAALRQVPAAPVVHLGSGAIVTDLDLAQTLVVTAGRGEVEVAVATDTPGAKAPMATRHQLDVRWTSLADGLRAVVADAVPA